MSIADMNALPDISSNDSERLQEFVRVTTREVKAVGGASAGTTLEMIGYIRELEHALTNTRAAVTAPSLESVKEAIKSVEWSSDESDPETMSTPNKDLGRYMKDVLAAVDSAFATAVAGNTENFPYSDWLRQLPDWLDGNRESDGSVLLSKKVADQTLEILRAALATAAPSSPTPAERTEVQGGQDDPVVVTRECARDVVNEILNVPRFVRNPEDTIIEIEGKVAAIISKHFAADQWRQGMKDAAKEVCDACDNEQRYGPAQKIEGSTRWWHGEDNIPCEAGGVWHALANAAAAPADNDAESLLQHVACSEVEFDDNGLGYVVVQIDRDVWEQIRKLAPTTTKGAR